MNNQRKFKLLPLVIAVLTAVLLCTAAFAEYVACKPGQEHAMSEWTQVQTNPDGTTLFERSCSKCGYVQKGFGAAGADGVATTRDAQIATTLSLDMPVSANPNTGARV